MIARCWFSICAVAAFRIGSVNAQPSTAAPASTPDTTSPATNVAPLAGNVAPPAPDVAPPGAKDPAPIAPDPIATAITQTFQPATRTAGIAALEKLWTGASDPGGARHALARALSWESRHEEALGHYDGLVAQPNPALEIVLERVQLLSWMGRVEEAEIEYAALVARQPETSAAHVGLARMRRWRGRPLAALSSARRGVELAPAHSAAREELASVLLALGLPRAARASLASDPPPATELAAKLSRATRPELSASSIGSADSFGVQRFAPRAKLALRLPRDVRLELGGGSSHLRRTGEALDYGVAGAAISLGLPRVEIGLTGAVYGGEDLLLSEASAFAKLRAHDALGLAVSARRRPLLETAEPLATGDTAFFAAGSGGATSTLASVVRRGVDELRLGFNAAPLSGAYVYADGRLLGVSDGNQGYAVAAGLGIDLVGLVRRKHPVALVARVDSFAVGYREQRLEYFSPSQHDGQTLGGQLVLRTSHVTLSSQGGVTFALGNVSGRGWTAGAGAELALGRFAVTARADIRDELAYTTRRAWLSIVAPL